MDAYLLLPPRWHLQCAAAGTPARQQEGSLQCVHRLLTRFTVRLAGFDPAHLKEKAITMSHHWDEFSKSLAEPVPRRESLRRLGIALTATVLSPLGSEYAWAGRRQVDPCKTFCNCKNKKQQTACLNVCKACQGNTQRICGSCGTYVCCGNGQSCCNGVCIDLGEDVNNCGACGNVCDPPGPYEYSACIIGQCNYWCEEGTIRCDGLCTAVGWDVNNCGACGNDCPKPGPNEDGWCANGRCEYACYEGTSRCNGVCTDLNWDPENCGACGNVCGGSSPYCYDGVCAGCPSGLTLCDGTCVGLDYDSQNCGACGNVCGGATPYCSGGQCTDCEGAGGMMCGGACIDVMWDGNNCGACGHQCQPLEYCSWGVCEGVCIDCN